ncbi:hypothetical protein BDN70DRAFT_875589 [Pholiota conissans]|uniref:Uncharacterized protein n=1 Tax=Pholiota conissans TaxID=109636 RepID=A0A9P5Z9M6_9AGAR|nr:hypothetical protein BDN70DRAFT_875589 [Pholiota conissans]
MSSNNSMENTSTHQESEATSFFSQILKPGSSLHPTFLVIVDCAFLLLLLVFITLIFLTNGNLHVFALIAIELGLWASVKWFVNELKKLPVVEEAYNRGEEQSKRSESETKKTI